MPAERFCQPKEVEPRDDGPFFLGVSQVKKKEPAESGNKEIHLKNSSSDELATTSGIFW